MAEPEILFEVDASKILAKLHLAGLLPCTYDKNTEFIVNSGIVNDNPSAKPDNPGNVEFDIGNKQGDYELGFVTNAEFKSTSGANSVLSQLKLLQAKYATEVGDKKGHKENGLLDKELNRSNKQDAKLVKIIDEVKKVIDGNQDILTKIGFKYKFDDWKKDYIKLLNKNKKPDAPEIPADSTDYGLMPNIIKDLYSNIKNLNDKFVKSESGKSGGLDTKHAAEREEAFKLLKTYLEVFVGPEKAKAITIDSLVEIPISEKVKDSKDKSLVANYEIVPANQLEVELRDKKNLAEPNKAFDRVCFKIGYSLQIDK